jgi:hypothetical protein
MYAHDNVMLLIRMHLITMKTWPNFIAKQNKQTEGRDGEETHNRTHKVLTLNPKP